MAPEWITIREAAEISGYHIEHVRRLIRADRVKARKFATVWQVDRRSLLAYLSKAEKIGKRRGPKHKA
jgi:hypothetical protein